MFFYDMLNSKHASIRDTVSKMDKTLKAAEMKARAEAKARTENAEPEKTQEEKKEAPAKELESTASLEPGFTEETAEEGQNNNERILEMHRQGRSTVEIAKELGLGVGEVKLVIDLYKA